MVIALLFLSFSTTAGRAILSRLFTKKQLTARLLFWHKSNYHEYPFREETDPYRVLVSEILLRQTKAEQVSRVYPSFVKKYPGIKDLAKAKRGGLQHLIKPLGIRSRVSDLLALAKRIEKEEHGEIPNSYGKLVKLPGVGRYIANSVLVKGYGEQLPLVDSNVNRVLSRLFQASSHINDESAERFFMGLAKHANPVRLNYAIIDLAHTICIYATPRCSSCPLGRSCRYALSRD